MSKKIFLLIVTFVLLISCTGQFLPSSKQTVFIPETHSGTVGVDVSFLDNAPPNEVFESQWFELGFVLENKGAVDVRNGVFVVGVPEDFDTKDSVYDSFSLKGRSLFYPLGDSKFYKLKVRGRELGPMVERMPAMVGVDVCYPYKTEFSAFVCIVPDFSGTLKKERVCTPSAQSFAGQGAPVAITRIDVPQVLPHDNPAFVKPQITLNVKNLGKGIVLSRQKFGDACTQRASKDVYNIINIGGSISDAPLTCTPQQLRLSEDDNVIVCTAEDGLEKSRGIHNALVNLNLDYGYLTKKTKSITIKRVLE